MTKPENIGVVGIGALGSKLALQALAARRFNVFTYDIGPHTVAQTAINRFIRASYVKNSPIVAGTLEEVIGNARTIHWTAPADTFNTIPYLPQESLLVLHASRMEESLEEAVTLQQREEILGEIVVAHCVMDPVEVEVAVATNFGSTERGVDAILDLGLMPVPITIEAHDNWMAETQGFTGAVGIHKADLTKNPGTRLKTPSTRRLIRVMEDNELKWPLATRRSVMSNPRIPSVLRRIADKIERGEIDVPGED